MAANSLNWRLGACPALKPTCFGIVKERWGFNLNRLSDDAGSVRTGVPKPLRAEMGAGARQLAASAIPPSFCIV
jgi:hypothetical protein